MSPTLSWADALLRLALGFLAGFLIGPDRGEPAHPAGQRTTILVSVAATAAMIQANWLVINAADTHISIVRADMMRLPLGTLSGIGFIGAGAILRRGEMVRAHHGRNVMARRGHRTVLRRRPDPAWRYHNDCRLGHALRRRQGQRRTPRGRSPLIDLHPGLCRGFEICRQLIRQWRRWRNYGLPRHRFLRVPADAAPQMSRSLGSHHAAHDAKRLGFARYSGGTACRNVPGR
jgi:hypothetical protein